MAPSQDPSRQKEPIELDGRTHEGGGQLLRNALVLSSLTSTPLRITHIRGNRSGGGGLKAQHLACVNWLAHATNAHVEGAEKGSKTLEFRPGVVEGLSPAFEERTLEGGEEVYAAKLEIGTAGSTSLALQAVLPFILFSKFPEHRKVFIAQVLLPTLARIGLPHIIPSLTKRGWSTGGTTIGSFTLSIPPQTLPLPTFTLTPETPQTKPSNIHATILAPTTLHTHITTILPTTLSRYFPSVPLTITTESSLSEKRLYILLTATYPHNTHILAADHLHVRKIRSLERAATEMIELVASNLAREVESGACVDEHLRDQLVIFQALAQGRSVVYPGEEDGELREPSLHARTAEWVARRMLGVRFDAEGVCEGVGFGREDGDGVEGVVRGLEEVSLGD
ncbi:hypothetical protein PRZ48_005594 [Zasmidium cellare]|uniref:RNA 3'-terminal phosphate cyclase domain-containing protein n=1 Tax=Zasmidium cellare TaxID=395010 RepID=A0ABR0ELA8_ZASCE|nr:hypothetical protein PRZ48_005594 [Zasmidium cellare]